MRTGVSYFSSRTLRHVRADLRNIVDHACTYVVHCFSETDLAYYRETMSEIVVATHEAGLEAWLDPWGVTGIFSGETFTRFPLDHPETWQVLSDGAESVRPARISRPRGASSANGSTPPLPPASTSSSGTSRISTSASGAATSPAPGAAVATSASVSSATAMATTCLSNLRLKSKPSAS